MDDGDKGDPRTFLRSDPYSLFVATLATLVIAGSALVWQSKLRGIVGGSHQRGESIYKGPDLIVTSSHEPPGVENLKSEGTHVGTTIVAGSDLGDGGDAKDTKISRSKERRRRGKDPLRDMQKINKRTKGISASKASRGTDPEDGGARVSITLPKTPEANLDPLGPSSLRAAPTAPPSGPALSGPSQSSGSNIYAGDEDDNANSPSTSAASKTLTTNQRTESNPQTSLHLPLSAPLIPPQTPDLPNIPPSHSNSALSSDSSTTPNTSPPLSPTETPIIAQADLLEPSIGNSVSSPSVLQTYKIPSPLDWDGASVNPNGMIDTTYRKPPRFRPKSRSSGTTSLSAPIPMSISSGTFRSDPPVALMASGSSVTSTSPSQGSTSSLEDDSLPVSFPTLNASFDPSSISPIFEGSSRAGSSANLSKNDGNTDSNGNGSTRHGSTRQLSTPQSGASTPPPSLSTQTQLASLRGALEAARMREEKMRIEMDRYLKDLEMVRWESAAWRRREAELQTQIHHLMHQLQTYASLYSSLSGQPSPLHHNPTTNSNANGSSNLSNGYQFSPSSSSPHPPPHLHIPPSTQMILANGTISSPSILSPMSMAHSNPHSPFYPYSTYSPHPYQPHVQQGQSPHQQSYMSSTFFPYLPNAGDATSSSRPSSVAGSSSVGSHSPDLTASSSTPPPTSLDRGRRRMRTQAAGPRIGERTVWEAEDGGEGWVTSNEGPIMEGDTRVHDVHSDDDDDDDGEGFSEALADAILKRPGSIRGLSKKGKSKDTGEESIRHTEFTFPSLSPFGHVYKEHSGATEAPPDGGTPNYIKDETKNREVIVIVDRDKGTEVVQPVVENQATSETEATAQ